MDASRDCSIVIPFHSNARLLGYSLATIEATVPDGVEILLVFNNSDASALPSKFDHRRVRVLDLGRSAVTRKRPMPAQRRQRAVV